MKKLTDLKIGILIGLIVSCGVLSYKPITEHYASAVVTASTDVVKNRAVDANFLTNLIEKIGGKNKRLGYDDVFAKATYKNLYVLLYQNALVNPEDEALKTIASAYGFTVTEARSVLDGSIEPIITKYGQDTDKTQQEIYDKSNQFLQDFSEMYDTFALEQELTIGGVASEIFSNGVVTDSGFDLVNDLNIIEEVIFGTTTEGSLGGPLDFGSMDDEEATDEYISTGDSNTDPSIPFIYNELDTTEVDDEISLESFDPTSLVQIQDYDVCPKPETEITGALEDFKASNPDNIGTGVPEEPVIEVPIEKEVVNPDSLVDVLTPEIPADWSDNPKCNGFYYSSEASTEEKKEEGEVDPSTVENEDEMPTAQIAADFFVCLEATTKWAKYGTVVSDKPCIKCETEKILAYLNKTLENSFIPNKVTGNFLEASKCKSTFTSLFDIKFNLIWNPVQTPRKDESNKLKSLRKEWDKFISKSKPLALDMIPMTWVGDSLNDTALSTAKENLSGTASYTELLEEVNKVKTTFAKKATEGSILDPIISSGENFVTYSRDVMYEVDQMTNYFLNFKQIFTTLADDTCPNILRKPKHQ